MTDTSAPSRATWLRWGLLALVILVGLGLLLWLGGDATPVLQTDDGGLFR